MDDVLIYDDSALFWSLEDALKTNVSFCLLLQASATHTYYSCICVTHGVGMYWRRNTWVSGAASWFKKLRHHFSWCKLPKSHASTLNGVKVWFLIVTIFEFLLSLDTSVATFTMFDWYVHQILNRRASEFLHTQNENNANIPTIIHDFFNCSFIFEINLTTYSLIEGF